MPYTLGICRFIKEHYPLEEYNVKYILQPGGSLADEKVQKACDMHGIRMFNVGHRMFYH